MGEGCCSDPCCNAKPGEVPRVGSSLGWRDRLGAWRVRWAIGRSRYRVVPGLYALGNPSDESPVLVTANYRLSFDTLRSRLPGRDAWVLVLDTKGINVWCAAGKGTFGTDEVVRRVEETGLTDVVSHRRLVLPQLGAPGVNAHEVKDRTGFRVVYGPVRAGDLPAFLDAGMAATEEMRRVRFPLGDRLAVAPTELVQAAPRVLVGALVFLVLGLFGADAWRAVAFVAAGWLAGTILVPALLPWLPGRAFAAKGAWAGACVALLMLGAAGAMTATMAAGLFLATTALSSFLGMNFTGCSTYTSPAGVRREVKIAAPLQALSFLAGLFLWTAARFLA